MRDKIIKSLVVLFLLAGYWIMAQTRPPYHWQDENGAFHQVTVIPGENCPGLYSGDYWFPYGPYGQDWGHHILACGSHKHIESYGSAMSRRAQKSHDLMVTFKARLLDEYDKFNDPDFTVRTQDLWFEVKKYSDVLLDAELINFTSGDQVIERTFRLKENEVLWFKFKTGLWEYDDGDSTDWGRFTGEIEITYGCAHNFPGGSYFHEIIANDDETHRTVCSVCNEVLEANKPHNIMYSAPTRYSTVNNRQYIHYHCTECFHPLSCEVHSLIHEKKDNPYGNLYKVNINGSNENPVQYNSSTGFADYPYKNLINTSNSTKTKSDPPFINFIIPQGGDFSAALRTTAFSNYFRGLNSNANNGKIKILENDAGFTFSNFDRIYLVENSAQTLLYQYNHTNDQVSINSSKIEKSDSGSYTSHDLFLKEVNRYGLTRYHKIKYHFCNISPNIALSASDGANDLDPVPENSNVDKNTSNTIFQGFRPNFNLKMAYSPGDLANIDNTLEQFLIPHKSPVYQYKLQVYNNGWSNVLDQNGTSNFHNSSAYNSTGSNEYTFSEILNTTDNDSLLEKLINAKHDTDIVQKYCLTVYARNQMGNTGSGSMCFYLDYGVKARPQLTWQYNVPVTTYEQDQRVFGKTISEEIDFAALLNDSHAIVNLRIFDENNFPGNEGFRGGNTGAAINNAKVFLKIRPDDPISAENSIITISNFARQQTGKGYYYDLDLQLGDFIDQDPDISNIVSSDLTIERILSVNGEQQDFKRVESVPVNIWNIPFNICLVYRDWIGNEYIPEPSDISIDPHCQYYFPANSKNIFTPAFCPDIDLTTVYIKDSGRTFNGIPEVLNPQEGITELELSVLPCFQDFTNSYTVDVFDQENNNVFTSLSTIDENNKANNLIKIHNNILYKRNYTFKIKAVNGNGYTTDPGSEFLYNFDRDDLTINAHGEILSDVTEWNWRYRLTGDVIVPDSKSLIIIPGGSVQMPQVYSDRKAKIIVKAGGKLIIDGSYNITDAGPFCASSHILNKDAFINLAPSGLEARMENSTEYEDVYIFDGENNWGGIYLEKGYDPDSKIVRARITGAYDGLIVFGAGSGNNPLLLIKDSLFMSNYIGLHMIDNSNVQVTDSVFGLQKEYGIKTEGHGYKTSITNVINSGLPNTYSDYYTGKKHRFYTFEKLINDTEKLSTEQGGN